MGAIGNLIRSIIIWGICLASMGELPEAVMYVMGQAKSAQQSGLISLVKLNRSLTGPTKKHAIKISKNGNSVFQFSKMETF